MLFHVSPENHRKIKALLLLTILSVSEGRRVGLNILAGSFSEPVGSARNAESLVHGRYDGGPKYTTTPTAAVKALQTAMEDPKLKKQSKLFAEATDAMLATPRLQEQARLATEHLKSITEDPRLSDLSKLLAEQIEALATDPKVQEWRNNITEAMGKLTENRYLLEHSKLALEQLSAIIDDTRLRQQSESFAAMLEAMRTDPKAKDQDLLERAKVFSEQLKATMENPGLQKHLTVFAEHIKSIMEHPEVQERAKLALEGLKAITEDQDFAERVELASEQSKEIMEHPALQEHSKLFAQQIEAMMTDSEVKERAAAAAKQLHEIMEDPAIHEFSEAIKTYLISQKTDGGPTLDLFSLAEVNRSSSGVSFVPPILPAGKPVAPMAVGVGAPRWRQLVPPWRRRHAQLALPRGRQSDSGVASDTSVHPPASAKGIRSMTPSLVNALPRRAKDPVMRGGVALPASAAKLIGTGAEGTFNAAFVALISSVALLKAFSTDTSKAEGGETKRDPAVARLQQRFLVVFWLFRLADWLQGPYFYSVYASKIMPGGLAISEDTIAKLFLTGFGTTAILGPFIGNLIDRCGRKMGSIAYALFYIWGALAVRSNVLALLLIGRVMGGIGTSLLMSAPESWLVGDAMREGLGASLGAIFGLAYFGDSIVAMGAGQLAQAAANRGGPTMPFTVSTVFLALGAILAGSLWKENIGEAASEQSSSPSPEQGGSIRRAYSAMVNDPKITLVGAVQALFEGAMYIFVLQWPPALIAAISGEVPFGKVFSCFMACCMFGSSLFKVLSDRKVAVEDTAIGMLALAVGGMATAAVVGGSSQLAILSAAFFVFELCVGLYFPTIGTLRAKYLPDEHRSILVNFFGIPLNLIVVTVFTQIKRLGTKGALWCSTGSLALSLVAGILLRFFSMGKADAKVAADA